jgi:signal transduction histidine kinase
VQDDGVGFDPDEIRAVTDGSGGGFGLRAMRERVEHSGGTLLVESEPGRGTALVVDLPVAACGTLQGAEVLEREAP